MYGTLIIELNTQNVTFNNLQFDKLNPVQIFRSKKTFSSDKPIKVTNSLDFIRNLMMFLENDRKKLVESLEFYFFLNDLYAYLVTQTDTQNRFIQNFRNTVQDNCLRQYDKVKDYLTILKDHIFWESNIIYLESTRKFVSHQLSGAEFVQIVFSQLLENRQKYRFLREDFEKQITLDLNPKIFQFSKVIEDFYLVLESFDNEDSCDDSFSVTESQLNQLVKNDVLPKLQKYFIN